MCGVDEKCLRRLISASLYPQFVQYLSCFSAMFRKCCVPVCNNKRQDVTLHKLPAAEDSKNRWLKCIGYENIGEINTTNMFVCHKHFEQRFVNPMTNRLKGDAYPSLFTDLEISSGPPSAVLTKTAYKMSRGTCLLCFSVTRVLDIKNTGLQNVYEVLSDSQTQTDSHPLCYICVTKLLQCQQILKQINKENNENQSDINPLARLRLCKTEEWSLPLDFVEIELTPLVTEIEIKTEYIKKEYVAGTAVEFVESPGRESKSPAIQEECAESSSHYEAESTEESAYKHIRTKPTQDDTKHACNVCNKTFISTGLLKIHHKQIHPKLKPFKCDVCSKSFDRKGGLNGHKLIHNTEKRYSCDVCSKTFNYKSNFDRHILLHDTEKPFSCDVCSKTFSYKFTLNRHILLCTSKKYSCDVCSKSFRQKRDLDSHILIHAPEKPYGCDVCGKSFHLKRDLDTHMLLHTETPYSCDVCSKAFSRKSYLNKHVLIHAIDKPYKCDICSKSFHRKPILKGHMLTHASEKLYSCDVCSKTFKYKNSLDRHKTIHTGG